MAQSDALRTARPPEDLWQRVLDGDRDAFKEAVAPYRDTMLRAARRKLAARRAAGDIRDDALTPEEVTGEALVRAFQGRARYNPDRMSLRAWLLGLQYRALNRLVTDEQNYTDRKAISLDEEVPFSDRYDMVEESFYEFQEPFDVTTYEDIIPGQQPQDVEIDPRGRTLTEEELEFLDRSGLPPEQREVLQFHDEFELSLPEIAQIMERSLQDIAEDINSARVHIRQWVGTSDVEETTGDDEIDSYTGEPVENNPNYTGERGPTADEPAEGRLRRAARDASPTDTDPTD